MFREVIKLYYFSLLTFQTKSITCSGSVAGLTGHTRLSLADPNGKGKVILLRVVFCLTVMVPYASGS